MKLTEVLSHEEQLDSILQAKERLELALKRANNRRSWAEVQMKKYKFGDRNSEVMYYEGVWRDANSQATTAKMDLQDIELRLLELGAHK